MADESDGVWDGEGHAPEEPAIWERNWAVFCHLGGFAGLLVPGIGQILGPLILWLARRDQSAYVDHHGREAVNFQISMTLYALVAAALIWVLIGFVLIFVVLAMQFVLMVLASVAASHGELYRYPVTLRLIQ
ncbi:DUF4870 domain-containing protein [Myxococcota bacterium]|nr:DUF4870 domain-containing protein [Myxococcota bacterium]MCZ7618190.1 DUF4870 domain-containing protein [Myxococcota bacterium]